MADLIEHTETASGEQVREELTAVVTVLDDAVRNLQAACAEIQSLP